MKRSTLDTARPLSPSRTGAAFGPVGFTPASAREQLITHLTSGQADKAHALLRYMHQEGMRALDLSGTALSREAVLGLAGLLAHHAWMLEANGFTQLHLQDSRLDSLSPLLQVLIDRHASSCLTHLDLGRVRMGVDTPLHSTHLHRVFELIRCSASLRHVDLSGQSGVGASPSTSSALLQLSEALAQSNVASLRLNHCRLAPGESTLLRDLMDPRSNGTQLEWLDMADNPGLNTPATQLRLLRGLSDVADCLVQWPCDTVSFGDLSLSALQLNEAREGLRRHPEILQQVRFVDPRVAPPPLPMPYASSSQQGLHVVHE